jgi:hypothetical protein
MNVAERCEAPSEEKPKTPLERIQDVKKAAQISKDLGFAIETVSKLETLVRFAEKYITSNNPKLKRIAVQIETYFEDFQKDSELLTQSQPELSEEWKDQRNKIIAYTTGIENLFQSIKSNVGENGFQENDFNELMGER